MSRGYALIVLKWPDVRRTRGKQTYSDYSRQGLERYEPVGWRRLLNITKSLKRGKWDYYIRYYFADKWAFAVVEWPAQQKERWALERIRYWFQDSSLKREKAWL